VAEVVCLAKTQGICGDVTTKRATLGLARAVPLLFKFESVLLRFTITSADGVLQIEVPVSEAQRLVSGGAAELAAFYFAVELPMHAERLSLGSGGATLAVTV
jgi:hypothetical protein